MENTNSKEIAKIALDALLDKKGEDVRVIDIAHISTIADYFVIASGNNPNHVSALVDNVEEQLAKAGYTDCQVEGMRNSSWVLIDYKDVVIHVFSQDDRRFYDLERMWRDGKVIEPENL